MKENWMKEGKIYQIGMSEDLRVWLADDLRLRALPNAKPYSPEVYEFCRHLAMHSAFGFAWTGQDLVQAKFWDCDETDNFIYEASDQFDFDHAGFTGTLILLKLVDKAKEGWGEDGIGELRQKGLHTQAPLSNSTRLH